MHGIKGLRKSNNKFSLFFLLGDLLPEKIYLVAQNIDHLKGRYFVSAVVIANSKEQAVNRVSDYLSEYEDVIFDENRVKAVEIGILTKRPNPEGLGLNMQYLKTTELLALELGEDFDL